MAEDWSEEEVAATVTDYFAMLAKELRREPYNKAEHNRQLRRVLNNRSSQAVEFKHANISAVLVELGFPYIDGYKPRRNYQERLRDEVVLRIEAERGLQALTESIVHAPATLPAELLVGVEVFVPAPQRPDQRGTYERRKVAPPAPRKINYLEREARNHSLGAAGELFALAAEHQRLWKAGRRKLAERIEHVSVSRGDGLGYDIHSFDEDGADRLIEVKTTSFGSMTPFFASANEVSVSAQLSDRYHLYRVFKFRDAPRLFTLRGSLHSTCTLDATQYRASLL